MIRKHPVQVDGADRAPRVCGDDPPDIPEHSAYPECSPRMRG